MKQKWFTTSSGSGGGQLLLDSVLCETPQQSEICVKFSVFHTVFDVKVWWNFTSHTQTLENVARKISPKFHAKFHATFGREKWRKFSLPHFCWVAALTLCFVKSLAATFPGSLRTNIWKMFAELPPCFSPMSARNSPEFRTWRLCSNKKSERCLRHIHWLAFLFVCLLHNKWGPNCKQAQRMGPGCQMNPSPSIPPSLIFLFSDALQQGRSLIGASYLRFEVYETRVAESKRCVELLEKWEGLFIKGKPETASLQLYKGGDGLMKKYRASSFYLLMVALSLSVCLLARIEKRCSMAGSLPWRSLQTPCEDPSRHPRRLAKCSILTLQPLLLWKRKKNTKEAEAYHGVGLF